MRLNTTQVLLFAFLSGLMLVPETSSAGWPWSKKTESGLKKYSPEWWSYTSSLPVGSRQYYKYGKYWPDRPRPVAPQQTFMQKYHHAHFWPSPYHLDDREIVRVFEQSQISKGWKNATTLYDYHFEPGNHQLTKSGRQHVLWIMQAAQPQYRAVHVQASTEQYVNDLRLASVNNYMKQISGSAGSVPVKLDVTMPAFRPAIEVETYQRNWLENMESPHIPYNVESSGSEGG